MDQQRFDELSVAVGSGMTRRRILRSAGGGAVATVLSLVGSDIADAGQTTKKGKGGNGGGKGRAEAGDRRRARGRTRVAMCHYQEEEGTHTYKRLPEPAANAHLKNHDMDYMVDLTSDTANCGGCGNVCPPAPDACSVPACEDETCGFAPVECAEDANECTVSTCDPATGCTNVPVDDDTVCDSGAGVCVSGTCTPLVPVSG